MDQHPPRPGRGRGRGCEKASDDGRRGARARYNDAQHDLETWSSDARVIVIIVRRLGPTPVVVVVVVVAQTHTHFAPTASANA